ncbi:hypothetical protein C7999DRAFT_39939 [Corynascus novoguineensis]|uniref:NACHT domain-containing protein n=1 Tax=Corynascus novoguineensis TaxID=1126955 RepID=A0AAN7CV89_9PEZI|nr:hypothetical protein C7999DRAFT_39939 [Corynascus novoguineensis]
MADPFGIVGVIGVAGQIAQVAVKLGLDWKDAPADAKRFLLEIQTLKTILSETLANILTNDDFKNAFDGRHSTFLEQFGGTVKPTNSPTNISSMVSACKQELDSLLKDLAKQSQGHRVGWERLKGAFLARKTRETVENLQRQCRTLNSLMAADALALSARIHKEVIQSRKEQQGWQADWKNKAVLDWVTTVDYSSQQRDFFRRRQAGTGQWLLNSTEYQQWIETAKQTLFCPGIPGAGKTILTSIVVDDLSIRFQDDVYVGIAYVYYNFRRQADQKVEDLISNLIRQLSQDQSSLPECLRILYDKHKGRTRPSFDELARVLQTVANLFSRVFIVVDALDECQLSDGSRSKFLTEIFALQNKTGANIFATSRFIRDVTERFKDKLTLEIRAQPEDVQRYINGNIDNMPTCVTQRPDLRKEVVTKIVQAVDGMFLLTQLHLDSLKGKRSVKAVRAALETLHTGSQAYDHAYKDAMDRIKGQLKDQEELAKQVLSWITCAKRPLSTTELQIALGVEVGETELDPDNIPLVQDIVSESGIIRLKRWFPNAQVDITDICATYLSFSSFESGFCPTDAEFEDRLRMNRLYDYAAHYWGEHAREAGRISQMALDFLRNDSLVEAQVQAMMTIKTPWWAARNGHEAVVKMLLDTGKVNVDSKDIYGQTPLSCAAKNRHEAVVKMLLDTERIDVNSKDDNGWTPLFYAAWNGHEGVVKMLLDTGKVDADSKDKYGRTPLWWAAINGHKATVKMLLDTGKVDVNSKDNDGQTPLFCAAENGHEAVVKMLLDTGKVDADSKNRDGQTPLLCAAENGYEAVVKMLRDRRPYR